MLIANPIYDTAFKYLLEDLDIARELISLIIGEEIEKLDVRPQEMTSELFVQGIRIFRLDFKATIKTKDGSYKKVLIELQKARELFDIKRFRRYLGENYIKGDHLQEGETEYKSLPIITIYFLGFKLNHVPYPVVKVGREFIDVLANKVIEKPMDEEFLYLLTHECYTIQIPRLDRDLKTKLEQVLSVFTLAATEDRRVLKADEKEVSIEPLYQKILDRLGRAMLSEDFQKQMDLEAEVEYLFAKNQEQLISTSRKLEKAKSELGETQIKLGETESKLGETESKLGETESKLSLLEIEKQILAEKNRTEQLAKESAEKRAEDAILELEKLKKKLKDKD